MPLRASSHPGSPNCPSCSALAWYSCWPGLSPWGESWKRTRVARTVALTLIKVPRKLLLKGCWQGRSFDPCVWSVVCIQPTIYTLNPLGVISQSKQVTIDYKQGAMTGSTVSCGETLLPICCKNTQTNIVETTEWTHRLNCPCIDLIKEILMMDLSWFGCSYFKGC